MDLPTEHTVCAEVGPHSTNQVKVVDAAIAVVVSKVLSEAGSSPVSAGKVDTFTTPISEEIKQTTLLLAGAQKYKELPKQGALSKARTEIHCTGTSSVIVKRVRTKKHKQVSTIAKETRKQEIRARRAESERSKGWISSFCDDHVEYEGLFNGKFGLNKETLDRMSQMVSDTSEKVKHVANNNKIALQHIFSLENCGDIMTMIVASIIAIGGARSVKNVKSFIIFVIRLLTGVGLFTVSRKAMQNMMDTTFDECDDPDFKYHTGEAEAIAKELEGQGLTVPAYLKRAMQAEKKVHEKDYTDEIYNQMLEGAMVEPVEEEGLFDHSAATGHILTGLLTTLGATAFGLCLSGKQKAGLAGIIKDRKLMGDLRTILTQVLSYMAKAMDGVFGTNIARIFRQNADLEAWGDDIAGLYEEFTQGGLKDNHAAVKRVYQLRMRGVEIKKSDMAMSAGANSYFTMMMNMLQTMEGYYGNLGVAASDRMEPVVVCLKGASGAGKSTLTPAIIDEVLTRAILSREQIKEYKKNKDTQTYLYLPEEDHVNGYAGQEAVIIDDMGQFLTQKGQKDDLMPIIRWKNTAPCRLNAAELPKKGNLTFTSSLVMCSTNLEQFYSPSILLPEALLRRFDFWVKLVPKVEYCIDGTEGGLPQDRRLDARKCSNALDVDACEFHLQKCDYKNGQTFSTIKVVSFQELTDMICAKYAEHKERHEALVVERNARIDRIVSDLDDLSRENAEENEADEAARLHETAAQWKEAPAADEEEIPVIEHEGLFRPVRNLVGRIAGRRKSLLQRVRDAFARIKTWYKGIAMKFTKMITDKVVRKWIRRVVTFLFILITAFAAFKLFTFVSRGIAALFSEDETTYTDPVQFMKYCDNRMADIYDIDRDKMQEIMHTVPDVKKRARNCRQKVAKGVMDAGKVTMFGATLKCAADAFIKDGIFWDAEYESELFDRTGEEPTMYHNKLANSIMCRNQWHMYDPRHMNFMTDKSGGIITMLAGRIGMTNAHFVTRFRDMVNEAGAPEEIVLVKHNNVAKQVRVPLNWFMDPENVRCDYEKDIAFIQFGDFMEVCRNIEPFFASEETIKVNRDFKTAMFTLRSPLHVRVFDVCDRRLNCVVQTEKGAVHSNLFSYEADTEKGDCGSLVMYTGDYAKSNERIIGVHMGGNNLGAKKKGYAACITQSYIAKMLATFDVGPTKEFIPVCEEGFLPTPTCHEMVEVVKPVCMPNKTKIIPSVLHGVMAVPTKRPAVLSKGALVKAHKKQDTLNVTLDPDMLALCVTAVTKKLKPNMKHMGMKLDFAEAIVGHPALRSLNKVPRATSAGYPLITDPRVVDGKKAILGYGDEYDLNTELCQELKHDVARKLNMMKAGNVPDAIYMTVMKDENRPNESVDAEKTRIIAACPLAWTVMYRMYFGAVINDIIESRVDNEIMVGVNPFGEEWDYFARMMQRFGPDVVAGDFSAFDNSQTSQAIEATMQVVRSLTGLNSLEDDMIMRCMAVTLSQPTHVSGSKVFEMNHGMPSGNPMTTIINSIFGMIMFRMVWLEIMKEHFITPSLALQAFEEHVQLAMYGDDNALNISPWAIKYFNQHTLMSSFPKLGMKYTSDQKNDLNPPVKRKLTEITFLKREFRFASSINRWVAPLDKSTILSMLDWTKKGASSEAITLDNCDNAAREWSLHGRAYYQKMTKELESATQGVIGPFVAPTFNNAFADACSHCPDWVREHT